MSGLLLRQTQSFLFRAALTMTPEEAQRNRHWIMASNGCGAYLVTWTAECDAYGHIIVNAGLVTDPPPLHVGSGLAIPRLVIQ